MLQEIGANEKIRFFSTNTTPQTITYVADSNDFDLKVFVHSDQRTAPNGVVSVEKRIKDIQDRWKGKKDELIFTFPDELKEPSFRLQAQIFRNTHIHPGAVNDYSIESYVRRFIR